MGVTAPPQHVNTEAPWGGLQDSKWPEDLHHHHHQEQLYVKHPPPLNSSARAQVPQSRNKEPRNLRRARAHPRGSAACTRAPAAPDSAGRPPEQLQTGAGHGGVCGGRAAVHAHMLLMVNTRAAPPPRGRARAHVPCFQQLHPPHPPRLQLTKTTPN